MEAFMQEKFRICRRFLAMSLFNVFLDIASLNKRDNFNNT